METTLRKLSMSYVHCRMLLSNILIVWLVIILSPTILIKAANTEELFNVYDMSLGGPILSEIEDEIEAAEKEKSAKLTQQRLYEIQNKFIMKYKDDQEKVVAGVMNNIEVYQRSNSEICDSIESNVLDGNINELLNMDNTYKSNINEINYLLNDLEDYSYDYAIIDTDVNIDAVDQRIEDVMQVYTDSLDGFNLGDVNGIRWIADYERDVLSDFGYRVDPKNKKFVSFHSGTDYAMKKGTKVNALFNGEVIAVGYSDNIGNFLVVQVGDRARYMYYHLSKITVSKGQNVKQYQTIAYSGDSGTLCSQPCLHVSLYLNGVAYNPDELFK